MMTSNDLGGAARRFLTEKSTFHAAARSRAALLLTTGIDMPAALAAAPLDRARVALNVRRLVERERLKGGRRHWSYDLNRHIALKQALEMLTAEPTADAPEPRRRVSG